MLDGEPSRAWRVSCVLTTSVAGATFAAWIAALIAAHEPSQAAWSMAAALPATVIGAVLGWRLAGPARPVRISWDGAVWQADGMGGDLQVMLDLGPALLLLRLRPASGGGARWIAISCGRGAGDLHALRTALYSRPLAPSSFASPAISAVRAPDRATD